MEKIIAAVGLAAISLLIIQQQIFHILQSYNLYAGYFIKKGLTKGFKSRIVLLTTR